MAENVPALDDLWDFNDPTVTEARFRELLPSITQSGEVGPLAELLTQIARAQGLQRRFDEADQALNQVESILTDHPDLRRARVRLLLERGRVLNSSGDPQQARPQFLHAWELARDCGEEALAVDAAHMLAIVADRDESLDWNIRALELAERSVDPGARKWRASLHNNIGWTRLSANEFETSLESFTRALELRREQGVPRDIRVARWCVARCLRLLGRIDDALAIQNELLVEIERESTQPDGFVHEEIAECLFALGRADEGRPHFARAYDLLSRDPWMTDDARLNRLAQLAGRGSLRT